jgi:hypothetical protein
MYGLFARKKMTPDWKWRNDTRQNDINHNVTKHYDTQYNRKSGILCFIYNMHIAAF